VVPQGEKMDYTPADARYDHMIYNRCGWSGLKLPAISLGFWHNFGGINSFETGRSIARRAFDLGITHFDLANNYGPPPGSAEENFGLILKKDLKRHRDELIISTKAGWEMWPGPYGNFGSRKYLVASLDQSLRRMGVDYVDIFYHHRPDPDTPIEETMGALDYIVRSGRALYIGISSYSADETSDALRELTRLNTPLLIHQPSYNMLDRWIEKDLVTELADAGVGCIAFSPLAQGILTDRYLKGIPADSRAAGSVGFLTREDLEEKTIAKVRKLNKIAIERGQTMAQMALAWVLRLQVMTSALVGASSVKQIEDNVASLDNLSFSAEELKAIDKILSE
jgi:L-glyceraldehyde 3-phosphate reductase